MRNTIASMSPDEAWDSFEDLATNFELWDDFGPRKPPPTQVETKVPKVYTVMSEPTGDDLVKVQFERLEATLNKKMDILLQTQLKVTRSQVNSVVSSPQCVNCSSFGHQTEECNQVFSDTEFAEVQQVNQVGTYA